MTEIVNGSNFLNFMVLGSLEKNLTWEVIHVHWFVYCVLMALDWPYTILERFYYWWPIWVKGLKGLQPGCFVLSHSNVSSFTKTEESDANKLLHCMLLGEWSAGFEWPAWTCVGILTIIQIFYLKMETYNQTYCNYRLFHL